MSVVPLHSEPEGVIMALNCFELHDEHLLPENEDFCLALNETASRHEYEDLMYVIVVFSVLLVGRNIAPRLSAVTTFSLPDRVVCLRKTSFIY